MNYLMAAINYVNKIETVLLHSIHTHEIIDKCTSTSDK